MSAKEILSQLTVEIVLWLSIVFFYYYYFCFFLLQVPLDVRGVIKLGCVCKVHRNVARALSGRVCDFRFIKLLLWSPMFEKVPFLRRCFLKNLYLSELLRKWYMVQSGRLYKTGG